MKSKCLKFTLFIFILAISGCAATLLEGPKFKPAKAPNSDQALVYIYRYQGGPLYRTPDILINDEKYVELPNLGYTYKYTAPGTYNFKSDWPFDIPGLDRELEVKLEPGKIYYIRLAGNVNHMDINSGVVYFGSSLKLMSNDIAKLEIVHFMLVQK